MPKIVDIEVRRAELAEAAARLIARSGIGAATVRDVAAEAGWTTGVVTHYFADKRELLLRTFQASLASRRALRAERPLTDPWSALQSTLEGNLPLDDDQLRHWMVTIAFAAQAAGDGELANAQRDAYRDHRAHVAGLVAAAALATGTAAEALAERLIAVADGIAVQAVFDAESWPPDRQLALLHDELARHAPDRRD